MDNLKNYRELKKINSIYDINPLTIIKDRYSGMYSGGAYLAFNLYYYEIPEEINSNDLSCAEYWDIHENDVIGKGDDPMNAIYDLRAKHNIRRNELIILKNANDTEA